MRVEYMLALRTNSSDRHSRALVMMRIASLSVAIGIGVMIIALAVIGGFRHQISEDLRGFSADIALVDVATQGGEEGEALKLNRAFVAQLEALEQVKSVGYYVLRGGMAKAGDNVCGLHLKGVGADYDLR